ncbi:MAG: transcription-repair coupling factor, partial [Oscillospiraceae bacterium]|nr:transcription-repair coupling factor [Oscillospiraceae bacterium]
LQAGEEIISLDRYQAFCQPEKATLFDYIEGEIFACEYSDILTDLDSFTWQMNEDVETLLEQGLLGKKMGSFCENKGYLAANLQKRRSFFLETFSRSIPDIKLKDLIDFTAVSTSVWGGQYNLLKDELNDMVERGYCVMVMAGTEKSAKTLAADLSKDGYNAVFTTSGKDLVLGRVYVAEGTLTAGFEYPDARVGLITYNVINEKKSKTTARKIRKKDVINSLEDIAKGDYVVHVTHGIGQFDGVTQLELQGVKKDYLKLLYAGKDVLFVPVTQLDLVSKYVGGKAEGGLKLNKLYSAEWNRTKARVYSSVKDMADELVKLYAARSVAKGYAFSEDNDWQMEFEERFPYAETDDQLRSISEIKQDMQKPQPMDRILCGDVGFGKTEVALRAMFKCVLDSKQCAILVPTTILAYQHYQTILKRMGNFPVSVELLSRFRTPKQQKEIIQRIKTGQVDIVVGTHRVIQKDVKFKDLGLAIIDEEQRFGVAHKERFKQAFEGIDLLTLTATPIPRTLNMAMTGIRDISVIDEPPQNRHPIQTYVIEHDDRLIADAIKKELRRGGQVYYLYNRVETIEQRCSKIRAMVPEATVEFAHGKMSEKELSAKWAALLDGTIDVLVCTTIIETGVDVANANTLIIEDADRMGLSQLYQLRGRVGRSARRAYAYFTFKRGKVLTEIAAKRLEAIREFTTFGSGFKIAMRDLEIRGAGNLLGVQQHGHMDSVGYDMYLRLLNEAVAERTGQKAEQKNAECLVDIQVDAYIPKTYVESMQNRIDLYKKIATIENQAEADDIMDEIIDRFSDPPKSVQGLIDVALLRNRAAALNVKEIVQKDDRITLTLAAVDMEKISKIMAHWASRARFLASDTPAIVISMQKGDTPIKLIGDVLATLEDKSLPQEEK